MGRIVEMIRNSDGEKRAVRVIMPNRNILQRSIIHLHPIECNDEEAKKNALCFHCCFPISPTQLKNVTLK